MSLKFNVNLLEDFNRFFIVELTRSTKSLKYSLHDRSTFNLIISRERAF